MLGERGLHGSTVAVSSTWNVWSWPSVWSEKRKCHRESGAAHCPGMARGLGSGQVSRVESLIEVHRGWAHEPGSGSSAAAPGEGAGGGRRWDALLLRPHWPAGEPSWTQEDPCSSCSADSWVVRPTQRASFIFGSLNVRVSRGVILTFQWSRANSLFPLLWSCESSWDFCWWTEYSQFA